MKKLTPVLLVEEIEPCLEFWIEQLGFTKAMELPEGDAIGFVMLQNGSVEVMLQSRASAIKDEASLVADEFHCGGAALYIEVDDLDGYIERLGSQVLVGPRTAFYGMREIFFRAPGGIVIGLAQKIDEQPTSPSE